MFRKASFLFLAVLAAQACSQAIPSEAIGGMRWRMIGPYRAGRTVGAAGIPSQPNVFYIGVNNGGVWKTNDAGRTWKPIFDDQPTGSIGAVAVAPSNPNVVYVGSGEGLQRPDLSVGNGMYKSLDAGKSWVRLGLRDGQQISAIVVDPSDENRLFVAVLGHPYGPNEERGVYRSVDGGKSFQKVLYKDVDTGAVALAFDTKDPRVIYADMWAARQGPWENGHWQGANSGLYRSTDGGDSWTLLKGGLPQAAEGVGRIGFCVDPSVPSTLYATVDEPKVGGIYRSDDRGDSWRRISTDKRLTGRGDDFAEIKVDPKNRETLYVANTCSYKSVDGGKTFKPWKGAPGGDDYHTFWINPVNPDIILLATDQGATISVNGGETWSSWYNQPTAQFYHVSTDNQFPYWVYGGQQESGSAGVASRGNDGQITFREWHPVGAEEYAYVAPDPLDHDIVYGGKVSRYHKSTGIVEYVGPKSRGRALRTAPLLFSPVDPHVLYFAGNFLYRTSDGAKNWEVISPDLSREQFEVPESVGVYRTPEMSKMARRGVIYTVGPSYKDINVIWAGTDDGLIHVTRDGGKHWVNVTPPGLSAWSKVSMIDAGRFDAGTAYAAVNRIRLDDMRPHIYRTHDFGKSWVEITNGLEVDPINTVREDPVRRGLLYCGSERMAYFSVDDGEHWTSMRLNMPCTSIRDLVIHENDVVVGTHGRSFWILDDVAQLRQMDAAALGASETFYKPSAAYILPRNTNTDTPLPPEEPAGKNPPDGAIFDYYLASGARVVKLEVLDTAGKVVQAFSSDDKPEEVDEAKLGIPLYWVRPFQPLGASAGSHRFVWDLCAAGPNGEKGYPISAIYHDTPGEPRGAVVGPGVYRVRLTVDGRAHEQPLLLKADPRVKG